MIWNGLPILIFGSGGISKETFNLIKQINRHNRQQVYNVLGFVESDEEKVGMEVIDGTKIVTDDNHLEQYILNHPTIGIVIPIGNPKIKRNIYLSIKKYKNIVFPNIIHPNVNFDPNLIKIGYGNIITEGVVLTCDIKIGNFNLINLNCTIGHDSQIKDFNVINPLVAISGNVNIDNDCLIGTGAKILQQLNLFDNVTVGAGAVVIKDVEENNTVVGIPAKPVNR